MAGISPSGVEPGPKPPLRTSQARHAPIVCPLRGGEEGYRVDYQASAPITHVCRIHRSVGSQPARFSHRSRWCRGTSSRCLRMRAS
jgi:hypothetical protein